jgi:hypothetical protein
MLLYMLSLRILYFQIYKLVCRLIEFDYYFTNANNILTPLLPNAKTLNQIERWKLPFTLSNDTKLFKGYNILALVSKEKQNC